ncbi:hypothetical protein [Prauserella flavalba]|uniref:Uncharacterized protein n=1 Tax=Prauserella flavalba TaxID=1477506 RepID=A0A318LLT8_9PSEU|nr:hypothetical protein [Prauserella flavalba]PXY17061.1 hypothetical protein BA062_37800 [Prauserella flavalba]
MTSTDLVGPLPTITFHGGPGGFRNPARVAYSLPRNTLDPRFAACRDHRPACDCREALLAENLAELRYEYHAAQRAACEVLAGHRVENPDAYTDAERAHLACQCTGCQIVRRSHLLDYRHIDPWTGVIR